MKQRIDNQILYDILSMMSLTGQSSSSSKRSTRIPFNYNANKISKRDYLQTIQLLALLAKQVYPWITQAYLKVT